MAAGCRTKLVKIGAAALMTGIAGFSVLAPQPAAAQGFFEAIFGGIKPRYQEPARLDVPSYAPSGYGERAPTVDLRPRYQQPSVQTAPTASAAGSSGVYCVRMCDGRYFPVPRTSGVDLNPAKVCNALCPAAKTKVFKGSNPERSVAADGTSYDDLDNALAFRDKVVPDCSCTGRGPGGLAQIDVQSDPTLRAGDVVVTAEGPSVFKGSGHFPYKTADFTPVGNLGKVHADLRKHLSGVQVNTTVSSVAPVQTLASGRGDEASGKRVRSREKAQAEAPVRVEISDSGRMLSVFSLR